MDAIGRLLSKVDLDQLRQLDVGCFFNIVVFIVNTCPPIFETLELMIIIIRIYTIPHTTTNKMLSGALQKLHKLNMI